MQVPSRHAVVLTHVAFEDIGSLEAPLLQRGFRIECVDVATADFPLPSAESCDLLIVMGGPIGVYDQQEYPFLRDEIECIRRRLQARRPTLGICLGAQLMASALGARVYAGERGAEIGWAPIHSPTSSLGSHYQTPEWFSPLLAPDLHLLHWHGDTFDLPEGAARLAETQLYCNQAFSYGDFALAMQFHPEVTASKLERWYIGHSCELRHAEIAVPRLRADAHRYAPALEAAAAKFWSLWLDSIYEQ
jgi:GMP synthase (glutamine-hydrolysing)